MTLGDGQKIRGMGVCKKVEIELQGILFQQNFLPFNLGHIDVILGVEWLQNLGDVKANWGAQTMKFGWEGRQVVLQGDPSLSQLEASLRVILKAIQAGGQGFMVKMAMMGTLGGSGMSVPRKLPTGVENLLNEY